jgi:hypothetical protein
MHIIQTKDAPPANPLRRSPRQHANTPRGDWTNAEQDITGIMLLEYCKRGTLHKALHRVDQEDETFPNRALWHIFHCRKLYFVSSTGISLLAYLTRDGRPPVIKGCIAMAYPPRRHQNLYQGMTPPLKERIPNGAIKERFLHFDLDPTNGKHPLLYAPEVSSPSSCFGQSSLAPPHRSPGTRSSQ